MSFCSLRVSLAREWLQRAAASPERRDRDDRLYTTVLVHTPYAGIVRVRFEGFGKVLEPCSSQAEATPGLIRKYTDTKLYAQFALESEVRWNNPKPHSCP